MNQDGPLAAVPDDQLLHQLAELVRQSRRTEADLVARIAEVDARRLYAREACPSMFAYCTEVLHLSEHEAYVRITAARAARQHPALLTMLADGRLHLSGIAKLVPHLTAENRDSLLQRATHKSKRQIEELIADLVPRPDAAALIRRLPARLDPRGPDRARSNDLMGSANPMPTSADFGPVVPSVDTRSGDGSRNGGRLLTGELGPDRAAASPLSRPAVNTPERTSSVAPIGLSRYRVQFTASAALRDKIERLRDLMRSSVPDGDLVAIIEVAVTEKLERLEARRFARTTDAPKKTPRANDATPTSRHVPAAVRRAVHERDGGRCRYVDGRGRRCSARERLEFHHRRPYGFGGDHSLENVCLMCHAHNAYLAAFDYTGGHPPGPQPSATTGESTMSATRSE